MQRTLLVMITDEQIALVQQSFWKVVPIADVAGRLIYERIFTLAPETRALFDDDISAQSLRLMKAVTTVVEGLDRLDDIGPFLLRLGHRHVGYGVRPEHMDLVEDAVLWALEKGLGDEFTPEVQQAWVAACGVLADVLKQGMREADVDLVRA
jgi:hemoglobin-like flavoprotein